MYLLCIYLVPLSRLIETSPVSLSQGNLDYKTQSKVQKNTYTQAHTCAHTHIPTYTHTQ